MRARTAERSAAALIRLAASSRGIIAESAELAMLFGLPGVATTGAHFAAPSLRRLAMAMGAIRARQSLDEAAGWLAPLGGSHLRSGEEMARLFAQRPDVVTAAAELGEQCAFGLALIAPQLPPFDVPPGHTEDSWLRELAMAGAERRYGPRAQARQAYAQIEHELGIIAQLTFPGYFLVVYDITRFCRENNILCQGRGSAANSAVCYALGVTAVDPIANELLFERFLSPVRDGPPDIDIDIESDQREKVIQYVYDKYGRDYAAQVANVITYRGRIAVRDMARALGFSQGQQDAWSKQIAHWNARPSDIDDIPEQVIDLATQIQNLPRHMGIHSGGMVICDRPIADVCPVEWARMENRSVLQWDKDDCAAIGLVKFDLLGLGMLSALHYAIDLLAEHKGIEVDLAKLDLSESAVYEMLSLRRSAVSGPRHAGGGGLRRRFRRRGRSAAARHGVQAVGGTHATAAWPVLRRHAADTRRRRRGDRPGVRKTGSLREFRFSGKPRAELRVTGVLLIVVQAASPGGVLRGAAARAADGLLLAAVAGGRRPQARGDGARPVCRRQPGARHPGERRYGSPVGAGRRPPYRR
jgi:DNA polymerase III alpha subunit